MNGMRLCSALRRGSVAVLLACALSACVKRNAPSSEAQQGAPASAAPAEKTGNYGKVAGVEMLGDRGVRAFQLNGKTDRVEVSYYQTPDQPFSEALRAKINAPSTNEWDVQLQAPTVAPVEQGDVLLASFYLRSEWSPDESGEGRTEFVFELARDPWTKAISYPVSASRQWRKIYVPFVASQTETTGSMQMIFRLGYHPEIIDIADVRVENFGKQLALADLPVTEVTYPGMESTAAWRQEAESRIERLRKADLDVVVQDRAGNPIPNAEVRVSLKRHAFFFGTAVPAERLLKPGNERFQKAVVDLFNVVTLENDLKWVALEGDWGKGYSLAQSKAAVDWLAARQIPTRGHVMVWPGWKNLPRSLRQYEKQPAELKRRVEQRVASIGQEMRGKLLHWDVLNEPFDNHDLMDLLGPEVMVDWFRIARDSDPSARLYINDYAILAGGGGTTPHRDHYDQTIQFLVDRGAPLDGIGMQGHFGYSLTGPEHLLSLLDRYGRFKKPILVTEYDIVIDDEKLAAAYTRDFYTTLFSHPAVEGIVMWGFWDAIHWKKNALLYRADWSLKPAGQVYLDLTKKLWHTDEQVVTDAKGQATVRGFHGEYEIVARVSGKERRAQVTLGKEGARTVVTVD